MKDTQYVRLTGTKVDPGYPRRLPGGWQGLPSSWFSGIKTVISTSATRDDPSFQEPKDANHQVLEPSGHAPTSPTAAEVVIKAGIDAAFFLRPIGKTYFFRGGEYVRLTGTKVDPGYPRRLPGGWQGLPSSWNSGIDAATGRP